MIGRNAKRIRECLGVLTICYGAICQAEPELNRNDGLFAALNLTGGYSDRNTIQDDFVDFYQIGLELRLQKSGIFVEIPGRSQEGKYGQFSGEALGYNFLNSEHWSLDAYFVKASGQAVYEIASPTGRVRLDRDFDTRFGLRATGRFEHWMAQFIFTPLSLRSQIGGTEFSASVRRDWQYRNLNLFVMAGFRYLSGSITDHFYGLSREEAAAIQNLLAGLPAEDPLKKSFRPYEAGASAIGTFEAGFEYPLSESFVLGGYASFHQTTAGIQDSPLRVNDAVFKRFALTLSYVF